MQRTCPSQNLPEMARDAILSRCGLGTGKHPDVISVPGPTGGTIKIIAWDRDQATACSSPEGLGGTCPEPLFPIGSPAELFVFICALQTLDTASEWASFYWAASADHRPTFRWDLGMPSFCIIIPTSLCDLVQVPAWRMCCCLLSQMTRNLNSHI